MDVVYNENERFAAEWLRNLIDAGHLARGRVDDRDIRDLEPADVAGPGQRHFFAGIGIWQYALRLAGVADGADVWTGSCPCQPFSVAGAKRQHNDERHLWPAWFALIRVCRPAIIFGEQVAGTSGRAWLDAVFLDLEAEGYRCAGADLCAASIGAPHKRQRLFWVAHLHGGRLAGVGEEDREEHEDERRHVIDRRGEAISVADVRSKRRGRPWRACDAGCDDLWCDLHEQHAFECPCPPVGEEQDTSSMGDADGDPVGQHTGKLHADAAQRDDGTQDRDHRPERASANGAMWADPDWVFCNDPGGARWRPVESGTFPLAPRSPGDVGRLRAYGNGIVAPLAAAFVEASLLALGDKR